MDKQSKRMALLYPLLIDELMERISNDDSKKLSDLLQEGWALDERTLFHQTFTNKEDILKAESLAAAIDDSGVQRKIQEQEQQQKRQKKTIGFTSLSVLLLAILTGWYYLLQPAADAATGISLQLPDQRSLTLVAGKQVLPDESIVEMDTVQHIIHVKAGANAVAGWSRIQMPGNMLYTLVLADSSRLTLLPKTIAHFPLRFSDQRREVTVQGKAFVEAAPDAAHPFIVHLGSDQVEVLGTSFEVSYTDSSSTIVSLHTGKVRVLPSGRASVQLHPGQRAVLKPHDTTVIVQHFTPVVPSWKGDYDMDYIPLSKLADILPERFGIQVQVAPSIAKRIYKGVIGKNESLDAFLQTLRFTSEAKGTVYRDSVLYIRD